MEKNKKDFIPEKHHNLRQLFRVLGPIFIIAGVICLAIALIDMFTFDPFGSSGFFGYGSGSFGGPSLFGLGFIGIPLIFVGFVLSSFGYGGAIARYQSREYAPVAKDTFNYLASEVKPGIKDITSAIRETNTSENTVHCRQCHHENVHDAKFCNKCGEKLQNACQSCGKENPHDASFCNNCGKRLM